jgi:hypothetical protein
MKRQFDKPGVRYAQGVHNGCAYPDKLCVISHMLACSLQSSEAESDSSIDFEQDAAPEYDQTREWTEELNQAFLSRKGYFPERTCKPTFPHASTHSTSSWKCCSLSERVDADARNLTGECELGRGTRGGGASCP